jgi:hypothetical protein
VAIQKPFSINIQNAIIDGKLPYLLSWKSSGETSSSFSISIYDNANNSLVWELPRTFSFALSYTIPAESIPNGIVYKMIISVWNDANQVGVSQPVIFTASSTPVVTVTPITTINNHTNLFTATYVQTESDPVSTYTANIYDAQSKLWKTSGIKTDGLLEYRFDFMQNDETYFIEFIATSKKGLTGTSGLVEFTVVYDNPSMYFELTADSIPDKASISLKWQIRQVIGKTTISPLYLDNSELDIRNGTLFFDEGFLVENDFTLKIWFREIIQDIDLITLNGSNGKMRVTYGGDKNFHLYKTIGQFTSHFAYPIDIGGDGVFISPFQYVEMADKKVFLCIQQKDGKIDMNSEAV